MQKVFQIILYSVMTVLLMNSSAYAASEIKFVSSTKAVENLKQSIEYVKMHSKMPAFFPAEIPETKSKLFASQTSLYNKPDYNRYWEISVGSEPGCQAHVCMTGSISASNDVKLALYYPEAPLDAGKQKNKQKVKLINNITGYYTPGHVEADYHTPTMEWRVNSVVYVLTWQIEGDAKSILKKMADTAIQSAH